MAPAGLKQRRRTQVGLDALPGRSASSLWNSPAGLLVRREIFLKEKGDEMKIHEMAKR